MLIKRVTIAKIISSGFDSDLQMFRRKFVGADGLGYDFVRTASIDRENLLIESAIANDLRAWLRDHPEPVGNVVPYQPRVQPEQVIKWLPQFRIARASRSYWRPERQHIHTRVRTEGGETINVYTPAGLIREMLQAFDTTEAEARGSVFGDWPYDLDFD